MAYTYEQFESEAGKAGLLDRFDQQDLIIARSDPAYGMSMLRLMQQSNGAKTAEQRLLADEAATRLRQDYSGYISGGRLPNYADEVVQQSQNRFAEDTAYRRALAQAGGYGDTAADPTLKDLYSQRYALEGQRAATDVLAAASARTGGRPSSYALTLAQQTGNDYKGQSQEAMYALQKDAYQKSMSTYVDQEAYPESGDSEDNSNGSVGSDGTTVEDDLGTKMSLLDAYKIYNEKKDYKILEPYLDPRTLVNVVGWEQTIGKGLDVYRTVEPYISQWSKMGDTGRKMILGAIDSAISGKGVKLTDTELAALYAMMREKGWL